MRTWLVVRPLDQEGFHQLQNWFEFLCTWGRFKRPTANPFFLHCFENCSNIIPRTLSVVAWASTTSITYHLGPQHFTASKHKSTCVYMYICTAIMKFSIDFSLPLFTVQNLGWSVMFCSAGGADPWQQRADRPSTVCSPKHANTTNSLHQQKQGRHEHFCGQVK